MNITENVDEIGKLSKTAQRAFIQVAQENSFTPTKSRETIPVDFLLVTTTNVADEEYICGAVRDRLVSIKIPRVIRRTHWLFSCEGSFVETITTVIYKHRRVAGTHN